MTMDGHIEVCESLLTDFPNLNGFTIVLQILQILQKLLINVDK